MIWNFRGLLPRSNQRRDATRPPFLLPCDKCVSSGWCMSIDCRGIAAVLSNSLSWQNWTIVWMWSMGVLVCGFQCHLSCRLLFFFYCILFIYLLTKKYQMASFCPKIKMSFCVKSQKWIKRIFWSTTLTWFSRRVSKSPFLSTYAISLSAFKPERRQAFFLCKQPLFCCFIWKRMFLSARRFRAETESGMKASVGQPRWYSFSIKTKKFIKAQRSGRS